MTDQKGTTSSKVFSLSEVLKMSDEEATKWNVLKYKQEYIRHQEEECNKRRNDKWVSDETIEEMMKEYIKEKGLANFNEVYDVDFLDWLDQRALNWFKQEYGDGGEDERK